MPEYSALQVPRSSGQSGPVGIAEAQFTANARLRAFREKESSISSMEQIQALELRQKEISRNQERLNEACFNPEATKATDWKAR